MDPRKYDIIAFDLDGTLSDPAKGLVDGFVYAFKKLGINYGERESLKRFIGPPLIETWMPEFGFSYEEAEEAVILFREYYNIYGWWDNILYPGIRTLLGSLKKAGKTVVLTTSKPEDTALDILKLHGIREYFDFVGGASSHKTRERKSEVIEYVLESVGIGKSKEDRSRCILIGDRVYDAVGARECGIDSIGVLWGHGTAEEIACSEFTYTAQSIDDVLEILK
ncbi:MAG: HAD hydrolase-like protein [Clostridia bacterium]|nr:HAD hydrolase-like protein [Clostridia bacterium]